MIIQKNNKIRIEVNAKRLSTFGMIFGLMFRTNKTENLLFEFENERLWEIHSLFVFFPFVAVWLDGKNRVLEKRIVNPFSLYVVPKRKSKKLIEIPINSKNKKIIWQLTKGF